MQGRKDYIPVKEIAHIGPGAEAVVETVLTHEAQIHKSGNRKGHGFLLSAGVAADSCKDSGNLCLLLFFFFNFFF